MRQITFNRYEIGIESMQYVEGNDYRLVREPKCEVMETSMTKGDARRVLRDSGIDVARGTQVYWSIVGRVRCYYELEKLMTIIDHSEELPLED